MENKVFIKGFDSQLKCRGYQFEIGKDYKIDLPEGYELTVNDLCSNRVFHFCDSLAKVHEFYSCNNEANRYCIIEVLGQMCDDGTKCGSNHIRIVRELAGEELAIAKGLTGGNTGLFNSGDRNSGDRNSGYLNSGDRNSGDRNSGDRNSGIFNKTNGSNGVFCNVEPKICIFNIQTDWTLREFYNSRYYSAIMSSDFPLIEWKPKDNPAENGVDGELIANSYEDACRRWWDGMTAENKAIIKSMPNFNIDVFCDITGIDEAKV
jgi:hypothetical protein